MKYVLLKATWDTYVAIPSESASKFLNEVKVLTKAYNEEGYLIKKEVEFVVVDSSEFLTERTSKEDDNKI